MIAFISCVKKKKDVPCKAKDIYVSDFFKKQLDYARSINPNIYILSAKYGVLKLDDYVEPYEKTLKTMSKAEINQWYELVRRQLTEKGVDFTEKAIFVCGDLYANGVATLFPDHDLPMAGMSFGNRLKFMKERTVSQ